MKDIRVIPGHGPKLHCASILAVVSSQKYSPLHLHFAPPFLGSGLLQLFDSIWTPNSPHVWLHSVLLVKFPHPPLTESNKIICQFNQIIVNLLSKDRN